MAHDPPRPPAGNLRRFFGYVRPHRGALVLATLVGVTKFNLPVAFPWILKETVDGVLTPGGPSTGADLDVLMGLALAVFVAYALATYFRTILADRLAHRIMFDVRRDLFDHLQRLPLGFFEARQTGAVSSRLVSDVSRAQNIVSVLGTNVFMELSTLVAISVAVFALDGTLALLAYATLPVFVVAQKTLGSRIRDQSREVRSRMERVEGGVHETFAGIADLKSFVREKEERRLFEGRCRHHLDAVFARVRTSALSLASTAFLTRAPSVLVLWVGGHRVLAGELTVGALMGFFAYLEMIYQPLQRLGDLNVRIANSRAAIDRIFEFFDETPEVTGDESRPGLSVRLGEIRYESVQFAYGPGAFALRDVDVRIEPDRRVALVGPSGAGKSTFVKLLVRYHEPGAGRILIDGQDIRDVRLDSLRGSIALVPQSPTLFSGSVEDNIRVGRADATFADVMEAAERANAAGFVRELPEGFRTPIGERGVRLSGGQRQRIAIARAFLKDASILVLDESSSQMDPETERLVYEALDRLAAGRTTIVIAHRASTVARADRLLVFEGGRIVQDGTHEELLRDPSGPYARLHRELACLPD